MAVCIAGDEIKNMSVELFVAVVSLWVRAKLSCLGKKSGNVTTGLFLRP